MKKTQVAQLEQANADLLTGLERGRREREILRQEAQREKAELVGNIWRLTEQLKAVAAERSASRQHEERLAAQAQRVPGLEQEVAAMRAERDALRARADKAEHTLHSIRHTLLWRVTWPLRKLMQLFKWLFSLPIRFTLWFVRLPKRSIRWMLIRVIKFTAKRPSLKARAILWLRKLPMLDSRVRRFAISRGLLQKGRLGQTRNNLSHELDNLPHRAREILIDLKAGVAVHHGREV